MKSRNVLISLMFVCTLAALASAAQAATLRFASETPRTDTQSLAAEYFNTILKERTKGALDIKLFADSSLGAFEAAISGVRSGIIDMAVSGSVGFTGMVPQLGLFDIPFMFKDTEHAYRVLDGTIGQDMLDKFAGHGMKGLAFWDNGWRQMSNSRRPIHTPDDVKGLKMRTTGSPAHIEAFKLLGATPVPMPLAELHTALEMGTVDAQEHPIGVFWSAKLFEVQQHLSLTYHAYSALVLVMNKAKFDSLPADQQKILVECAREAGSYQRKLNNDNIQKIAADVAQKGVAVVTKVDSGPFLEVTKPGRKTFTDKFGGEDYIKAIDELRGK